MKKEVDTVNQMTINQFVKRKYKNQRSLQNEIVCQPKRKEEFFFELTALNTLISYNYNACKTPLPHLVLTCACESSFSTKLMKKGKAKI